MLLTTPCFAQGLGTMPDFGGIGKSRNAIQNYGNTHQHYGQFHYNFGNNPNVYTMYPPQVSDYLTPDPRQFKAFSNPMDKVGQNYLMKSNFKINQFNYNQPLH
jgi:hypothetical protein